MKKRIVLSIIFVCVLAVGAAAFGMFGRKPFRGLQASEVASATVHLAPPDKTLPILQVAELVSRLNHITIYNRDDSYHDYCGQAVTFSLTMADGSQMEVTECNPFLIIDGVGYRTKYEPCEQLSQYANRLLSEGE